MTPSGRALQALLSPHRTDTFLARYWDREPLYIPGPPEKFRHLSFDLRALERAILDPEPRDRFRVRFVDADNKVKTPSDLERHSIRDGDLTVCADWINDRFDTLASYCAGIKTALSLPGSVFMTCYASPDGHGFGTHWDCQASFILQIEGAKRWRFSASPAVQWPPAVLANARVVPEMRERYPWMQVRFPDEQDEAAFLEQVLTPGDVLFLPAGTWHQARAIDYSLALTMACVPMTAGDFVDDLVRGHLSGAVSWRASVPPVPMEGTRPDRLPPAVKRFFDARLAELRKHVRSLRAEDLYETWTHHVASFDTPLAADEAPRAPEVTPTDTFRVAREFPLRYVERPAEATVALYYLDNRLDLSWDALPLVKMLVKRSRFPAHAVTRWLGGTVEWADVKPVLQQLVQAGVLEVHRRPPAAPSAPAARGRRRSRSGGRS